MFNFLKIFIGIQKYVSKLIEPVLLTDLAVTIKEPLEKMVGIIEEETNVRLKQQMEQLQATLASTEIAAEMAEKAARLLARAAESNKGDKLFSPSCKNPC